MLIKNYSCDINSKKRKKKRKEENVLYLTFLELYVH
jgi:hypothetical protein